MAFELDERGNINSLPVFSWESAIVADAGCLLRLVLARRADAPETDAVSVQVTMSAEQMDELAQELSKMSEHIRAARQSSQAH